MTSYVLRRLVYAALTLLGVTIVVFVLIHAVPGDPVRFFIPPGSGVVPEGVIDSIRAEHHLDRSLPVRYLFWVSDLIRFDLGTSFSKRRPVAELILQRLPRTLELNLIALFVALVLAVPIGVLSGSKPGGRLDKGSGIVSFLLYSLPNFWVALLLMQFFAVKLQILPLFGMHSDASEQMGLVGQLLDHLSHLILPVVALAYTQFAILTRFTRSSVVDVVRNEYIVAARARGSSEARILWLHALRNALIPLVTLVGLMIPYLLSGSVIIERMFQWDGVGGLFFDAILSRDYPVVMGLTVMTAVITLVASVLTDLAYAVADPRVRLQSRAGSDQ